MQEVFYRLLKNFCGILFLPPDLRLCHELPYPFSLYKYTLLQPNDYSGVFHAFPALLFKAHFFSVLPFTFYFLP